MRFRSKKNKGKECDKKKIERRDISYQLLCDLVNIIQRQLKTHAEKNGKKRKERRKKERTA